MRKKYYYDKYYLSRDWVRIVLMWCTCVWCSELHLWHAVSLQPCLLHKEPRSERLQCFMLGSGFYKRHTGRNPAGLTTDNPLRMPKKDCISSSDHQNAAACRPSPSHFSAVAQTRIFVNLYLCQKPYSDVFLESRSGCHVPITEDSSDIQTDAIMWRLAHRFCAEGLAFSGGRLTDDQCKYSLCGTTENAYASMGWLSLWPRGPWVLFQDRLPQLALIGALDNTSDTLCRFQQLCCSTWLKCNLLAGYLLPTGSKVTYLVCNH